MVVATGVNAEGPILGLDVGASEDGAFWLAFLPLTARGLSGVDGEPPMLRHLEPAPLVVNLLVRHRTIYPCAEVAN